MDLTTTDKCEFLSTGLKIDETINFDEWQKLGGVLQQIETCRQWWWGDYIRFGERKFGEMYVQAIDETKLEYSTLRDYVWVANTFNLSDRSDNLSWDIHRRAASAPEPLNVLQEAEENKWTRRDVQERVKQLKKLPTPKLPEGKYQVIYADPAWEYSNSGISGAAENHYPTMATDDICNLPIKDMSDDNAVLFMWVTNPLLEDAIRVVTAWGFEYKTNIVWIKDKAGQGFYVKGQHELLFIATKGSFTPDSSLYIRSVIETKREEHSRKPAIFYETIEKMYPDTKKVELFARKKREGWESWGNEL